MTDRPLFILGAGADKGLGLPLMNDLMADLRAFKEGQGKEINAALRRLVKYLHFDFDKYAGDKGAAMGSTLLGDDGSTLRAVRTVINRPELGDTPQMRALRLIVERLEHLKESNDFGPAEARLFAEAQDLPAEIQVDFLIDPAGVRFTDIPRRFVREALKSAYESSDGSAGRGQLYELLLSLSNFEELLGDFFTGFFTRDVTAQRRYFYLSWLFWAYIRFREAAAISTLDDSLYGTLQELSDVDLITFNYTRFAAMISHGRAKYFHGDNDILLDFDTRELTRASAQIRNGGDLVGFLDSLTPEFGAKPKVIIPGLVPPLIMKPLLASEYLDWWYESAKLIEDARQIVIVGYSFAYPDEHFNDLVRKRAGHARIVDLDPFWDGVCNNLCRVVGQDEGYTTTFEHGFACRRAGRLTFYQADASKVSTSTIEGMLADNPPLSVVGASGSHRPSLGRKMLGILANEHGEIQTEGLEEPS